MDNSEPAPQYEQALPTVSVNAPPSSAPEGNGVGPAIDPRLASLCRQGLVFTFLAAVDLSYASLAFAFPLGHLQLLFAIPIAVFCFGLAESINKNKWVYGIAGGLPGVGLLVVVSLLSQSTKLFKGLGYKASFVGGLRKPTDKPAIGTAVLGWSMFFIPFILIGALDVLDQAIVVVRRKQAEVCVTRGAIYMERFYTDNLRYDKTIAGDPVALPAQCPADLAQYYTVSLASVTASTYTIQAVPQGDQADRDTACGTLAMTQAGTKSASGGGSNCWPAVSATHDDDASTGDSTNHDSTAADAVPPAANAVVQRQNADPLTAAFAVAFPAGAIEKEGDMDYDLIFSPQKLVYLGGETFALISTGKIDSDLVCHACVGKLRVSYLNSADGGNTFGMTSIQQTFDGNGWGAPPDWQISTKGNVPVLHIGTGYTEQGCTVSEKTVYTLKLSGVVYDAKLGKQSEEDCDIPPDTTPASAQQPLGKQASFDCSKAVTPTATTICANPELSALDGQMGVAYRARLAVDPSEKTRQRLWLKQRITPCGSDAACLKSQLSARLQQLQQPLGTGE